VAAICSFQAQVQFEHQINGYIWIILSKTAKWGQRAQFTFKNTLFLAQSAPSEKKEEKK
jgi:hypothetical protein